MTANLTKNQNFVLQTLETSNGPMGAYDILDHLRDKGFKAPLQVYRALDKLMDLGLIHRLDSLNAFVACRHDHETHTGTIAFAICEECGQVSEFEDTSIRKRLSDWSSEHGFKPKKTTVEIRGRCKLCCS